MPARALVNTANAHLINFYRWLQKGLLVDPQMGNDERLFYQHRDRFNALLSTGKGTSREAAAFFYFLNRIGFNGFCRFNRTGEFNVPFGRYAQIGYTRDFTPYRDVFADWTFSCRDVEAVPLDRDDFVYAGSRCWSVRALGRCISREPTACCGCGSRASGTSGERQSSSSNLRRSSPGSAEASACSGPGRASSPGSTDRAALTSAR